MELELDTTGAFPIARLSGEVRSEDGARFIEELHPLVSQAGSKLAIDLSGVAWLDSAGLSSLINIVTRARLSGGRAILSGPTPFVAGVLDVTNLDRWFEIVPDLEEAARRLADAE